MLTEQNRPDRMKMAYLNVCGGVLKQQPKADVFRCVGDITERSRMSHLSPVGQVIFSPETEADLKKHNKAIY